MVRVLGIGDNTVDIYIDEDMQFPGGNAVNVAVQARRRGASASYLGCFGADELGVFVRDSLIDEDVDMTHSRRIEGPNPWSRIIHEGGDRVFAGSNPGVRGCYNLAEYDFAFIAKHDIVHTSVHSDLDAEMSRIRRYARLLSYDYSEHWQQPGAAETFPYVDIAFVSCARASEAECRDLVGHIASLGPSLVVVTRGALGSLALQEGRSYTQGIVPALLVDTLGAGDAFIAGFLVSFSESGDVASALALGASNAAAACATKGAFGHGRPTRPGQPGLDPNQVPFAMLSTKTERKHATQDFHR
jgi:fructoselysine 6-kinase